MQLRYGLFALAFLFATNRSAAQVLRVAELTTQQIRALDRAKTVVLLPGGMLEEHGPYLPAFTDGILSDRLTKAIAAGVIAKKPGWTVLVFPPVSVGASGSNEIGGQFRFPGTYAVRPSTLRATYMDLATELGEQGFKWVMVVNVHGSPLHIGALDDAGDFFHDTYGGQMVNLWGLLPVLGGWGGAMSIMTDKQKKEDGVSLNQWIAVAVAQKIGVVETAAEFFKRRAKGASGKGLMKFLRQAPKGAPESEDSKR